MYKKRVYRRKRVSTAPRKVARSVARKVSNQKIAKVVKKVMKSNIETKVLQYGGGLNARQLQVGTTQAQFDAGCVCITPQGAAGISGFTQGYPILGEGINFDQRIGAEVKIKAIYVDYLMTIGDYDLNFNPSPQPQIVKLYLVKPKSGNAVGMTVANIVAGSSAANFYETDSNGTAGMTGFLNDDLRRIDKDNYEIVAVREHKLGFAGKLNTSNVVASLQNNDMPSFVRGRIKIPGFNWKVDRQERFQGRNIYMFAQCMNFDNSLTSTTYIPIVFEFNETIYYQDA